LIIPPTPGATGISGGAIAGIVIGSVVALVIVVLGVVMCVRHIKTTKDIPPKISIPKIIAEETITYNIKK
jgi:Ca2+/Na+ antiporter